MRQVTLYREPGRFAGWPANYGIWAWNNEIVVGFTVGYHKSDAGFHRRDRDKPFTAMQARSLDGGETWTVSETPCRLPGKGTLSADEHGQNQQHKMAAADAYESPRRVNFVHPDFAMMCSRTGLTAGAHSWFYTSTDRCKSWQGPFRLPDFGYTGIAARTDYLVSNADECLLFLTAAKANGQEGLIFCARTVDGGISFSRLSQIGPEPEGFAIMPASVRLSETHILVAVRCRGGGNSPENWQTRENWLDLYASDDNGQTWHYKNRPVENTGSGGNPPTLTLLHDGRLCLIYGYRDAPYRICAKLSGDAGETWSSEIVLRDNGGDHDIGYPRTVQRPDGTIVTAYYFDEEPDGERFIEATLWKPHQ